MRPGFFCGLVNFEKNVGVPHMFSTRRHTLITIIMPKLSFNH
jgi:hypothetical protein